VGIYSYGIYLIHLKAGPSLSNLVKTQLLPALPESLIIFINFLFSIGCGYLLSILIEKPFLRLRDKYFPSG
jgi:peptidoglycan/LPS O-acetylase OafA/YrhL